jgi:hypothetical protein
MSNMEDPENPPEILPCSDAEPGSARAARLRQAIALVGSIRAVSEKSGVRFGTLQSYRSGGEMKLSNAAALARATGVRLEWLATGEGPMQEGEQLAHGPEVAENRAFREVAANGAGQLGLTWQANPDRMARAYEMALSGLAVRPGHHPDPRRLMQVTLLIYDELTATEEPPKSASEPPA